MEKLTLRELLDKINENDIAIQITLAPRERTVVHAFIIPDGAEHMIRTSSDTLENVIFKLTGEEV